MVRTRISFSIENVEKMRFFFVFFRKNRSNAENSGIIRISGEKFFFRKHTSLSWEQDAENRIEKYQFLAELQLVCHM